ncbi:MAG: polyketide cyclase [Alteromonadaceae bacterium]|nr:MAG: polyketide cyclase [Alteromonadaceae bacterium]
MIQLASFSINTTASIDGCFHYLSNMKNFGNWFPEVIKIVEANRDEIGLGKQYVETVKVPGRGLNQMTLTVKEHETPSKFATEGDFKPLRPRMQIKISENSDQTTRIDWSFYSRNEGKLFGVVMPLFKYVMGKRAKIASFELEKVLASIDG